MSNTDPFREMVEAYALGALDAEDRAAFEAHLATHCAGCGKALKEARWFVAQLAYLAPDATPSDMLKGRLMQTVRAGAGNTTSSPPAKADSSNWLWLAVAALVLFSVYSEWNAHQLQKQIREVNERAAIELRNRERMEKELVAAKREAMILTDPASVKIALTPSSKDMPSMEAMWHWQMGLCVMGHKVPMPAENHVLQLWLIPKKEGAKPMPSITFWPEPDGKIYKLVVSPPEAMQEVKALAITEEPAGGSPQPTSAPMWIGSLS